MEEESFSMLDDAMASRVVLSYIQNSPPEGRTAEEVTAILHAVDASLIETIILEMFFSDKPGNPQIGICGLNENGEIIFVVEK